MGQIRDFVYLDISRLYSMYSQVFEKLTESVIEERANDHWQQQTKCSCQCRFENE